MHPVTETRRRLLAACAVGALITAGSAAAQNTGGVFGPAVNAEHRSMQYRVTYDPDGDLLAQRFHYQQALDGDFMLRGVVQGRKTADSDLDFDYLQAELFWDLGEDGDSWRQGLRLDLRVRDDDRPSTVGLNWTNQWALAGSYRARFLVLTSVDAGDNARDGLFLQSRGSLVRRLGNGPLVGLEIYNSYGSTDRIPPFEDQRHQAGPILDASLGAGRSLYANVLFGLTEATPDAELRLWLTLSF